MLGSTVVGIDAESVTVADGAGKSERIPARTVVWAAGVTASKLAARLAELTGAELDRAGRIEVGPDLTLPGHPEVFALGDMIRVRGTDGSVVTLPGVAPVAMQQGRYAARVVRARLESEQAPPFHYHDKGNLATIGRGSAVADIKGLHLSGFLAWVTWLVVHLWYLVGFENRVVVFTRWGFSFVTHGSRRAADHGLRRGRAQRRGPGGFALARIREHAPPADALAPASRRGGRGGRVLAPAQAPAARATSRDVPDRLVCPVGLAQGAAVDECRRGLHATVIVDPAAGIR